MTLARALTFRAAFNKIKRKLADEGCVISEIKHITDLAPVLATMLPDNLAKQAEHLLADPDALESLLTAFTGAAEIGVLAKVFHGPEGGFLNIPEGKA